MMSNNQSIQYAAELYDRFRRRSSRDDEFAEWAGYREKLTAFTVKNARLGSSLLILGAGRCSDLDLKRLGEHFGSITLSDYRPETMEEALHRYGLQLSERFHLQEADYVGITDEDYLGYTEHLIRVIEELADHSEGSPEEAAGGALGTLKKELEQIYERNKSYEIDLGDKVYDCVLAAGVHSQLNNSFRGIFQYVGKDMEDRRGSISGMKELNEAIFKITGKHTQELIRRFNRAVFSRVGEGIVYGAEKSILYTPRGEKTPVIGTVDGARQALEEAEAIPASDQLNCLWPLSRRRKIRFEMDIRYYPASALTAPQG